jgi:hypothetical protein
MELTPEEAVRACLDGIDRNVPVTVEPAAAKLLMPSTVRTAADILALGEWPAEQVRLVVERWQPAAEVRIERLRDRPERPFWLPLEFSGRRREGWVPDIAFGCVPTPFGAPPGVAPSLVGPSFVMMLYGRFAKGALERWLLVQMLVSTNIPIEI